MAVYIIGGGLAGCEAAWQIAKYGIKVKLYEMKPRHFSEAHTAETLAELVCSNSLKASNLENASGLLKEEMRVLGGLIIACADRSAVPAGGALAVDRIKFSEAVTKKIERQPEIELIREEVCSIRELIARHEDCKCIIIATGPLTTADLSNEITEIFGLKKLHFFDAAAPVIFEESIDHARVFRAARYGKGEADYINCPMKREEYLAFYEVLIHAECAHVKDFDSMELYEGCMPVESMAKRGMDTLRFGPLKPVGLRNPETREEYYAVVQLRQDNQEGTLYNMVGFQTRLKFGEQKRVFGMIPGLEKAEYARYGVMHKNIYIQSPEMLGPTYRLHDDKNPIGIPIYFAGQITGVEGYMESTSSGLVAGMNAAREQKQLSPVIFSCETQIGALASYVSAYPGKDFQPMGANFGILRVDFESKYGRVRDKRLKKRYLSENALNILIKDMKRIGECSYGKSVSECKMDQL